MFDKCPVGKSVNCLAAFRIHCNIWLRDLKKLMDVLIGDPNLPLAKHVSRD